MKVLINLFTGKIEGGPGKAGGPKQATSTPLRTGYFTSTPKCQTCNHKLPLPSNLTVKPKPSTSETGPLKTEPESGPMDDKPECGPLNATSEYGSFDAKPESGPSNANPGFNDDSFSNGESKNAQFLLKLLQDSVRSTYTKLEKVHIELKSKLSESVDKCEQLKDEVLILQKKHDEDIKLISNIEKQALMKYHAHSAEIKNYQSLIDELQNENSELIKDRELLQFYKSQSDKLLQENAKLHKQVQALTNKNHLEVLSKTDGEIWLRPVGSRTRPKKYIHVENVNTPSFDADISLLKKRASKLSKYLKLISCIQNQDYRTEDLVKTLSAFIKENGTLVNEACNDAGFSTLHGFSLQESADLKVLLGLSFKQYHSLVIALKKKNIHALASESKVREELRGRISTIRGEMESGILSLFASKRATKPENVAYCRIRDISDSLAHTLFFKRNATFLDPFFPVTLGH